MRLDGPSGRVRVELQAQGKVMIKPPGPVPGMEDTSGKEGGGCHSPTWATGPGAVYHPSAVGVFSPVHVLRGHAFTTVLTKLSV